MRRPLPVGTGGAASFSGPDHSKGGCMVDKRTVLAVVIGAYILTAISRVVPGLAPGAVAGYLPSFGGDKSA